MNKERFINKHKVHVVYKIAEQKIISIILVKDD